MASGEIMFIKKISSTKRDTFKQCRLRYDYKYNQGLEGTPGNEDSLNYGQFVHKIFEEATKATHIKELEKLAEHYRPVYKISSSLNNKIKVCLENFLKFNSKLTETVATELDFELEIGRKEDEIKLNGVIDRIVRGKSGGLLIIDYKTSKREKTKIDLYSDPQLKTYCYAAYKLYNVPIEEIVCAHYYPQTNTFVDVGYSKAQINSYITAVIDDVWKIRKAKACDFPPSKNEFCDWCEYKNMCSLHTDPQLVTENVAKAKERKKQKKLEEAKKDSST